jgi:Gly-Xaa carboxypeptidase
MRPVAEAFNLTIDAFGSNPDVKTRFVNLTVFGEEIEPAPKTPTSGPIWNLFAGSIRHVLKDDKNGGKPYTVSPFYSSGNTDTQRTWNLSKHIYRYVGSPVQTYAENAHSEQTSRQCKVNHTEPYASCQ